MYSNLTKIYILILTAALMLGTAGCATKPTIYVPGESAHQRMKPTEARRILPRWSRHGQATESECLDLRRAISQKGFTITEVKEISVVGNRILVLINKNGKSETIPLKYAHVKAVISPYVCPSVKLNDHILIFNKPDSATQFADAIFVLKQIAAKEILVDSKGELYVGLGAKYVFKDKMIIVTALVEGSPAYKSGIKVGDRIVMINGDTTNDMSSADVSAKLRGQKGTSVTITIMRKDFLKLQDFTLTRDIMDEASRQNEADFEKALLDYRNAATKPMPSEGVRKYKVQAEDAVRDKKLENAADLYREALNIAPWWAEGHFNRALVLSEVGDFGLAIFEMKRYLLLVPNAPNARAAQDKIYIWEGKAGEGN